MRSDLWDFVVTSTGDPLDKIFLNQMPLIRESELKPKNLVSKQVEYSLARESPELMMQHNLVSVQPGKSYLILVSFTGDNENGALAMYTLLISSEREKPNKTILGHVIRHSGTLLPGSGIKTTPTHAVEGIKFGIRNVDEKTSYLTVEGLQGGTTKFRIIEN